MAKGGTLSRLPLLADTPPGWFDRAWGQLSSRDTDVGSFWLDWYQRLLDGHAQNWPLLLEIATQDDAFWQGSDPEINARIAEIAERHDSAPSDETLAAAADVYPLGETIVRDDQNRCFAIPDPRVIADEAFDLAKRRGRNTIADMNEDSRQSNQLRGLVKIADSIARELNRSADAPVLVYESLSRAVVNLQALCQHDDLIKGDPTAEHTVLQYRDRLLESAYELRTFDPTVRANHDAKAALKDKAFPLPSTTPEKLRAIGQFVHVYAAGVLAEQMPEDAELVLDQQEPEENRKSALLRFGARVVRILILDRHSVQNMANAATLIQFSQSLGLVDAIAALVRMFLA